MEELQNYLSDAEFSDDFRFVAPATFDASGRTAALRKLLAGQRVAHIGFADHAPLIASRVAEGSWLHTHVVEVASAAVGIDINEKAVRIAQSLGVQGLHCLDIFSPAYGQLCEEFQPTLLLVPDVLEHLDDPIGFLQRLKVTSPEAALVVSLPNGLSLRNTVNALLHNHESINTEHLAWYSFFTASKLLHRGGYRVKDMIGTQIGASGSMRSKLSAWVVAKRPLMADNIILRALAI